MKQKTPSPKNIFLILMDNSNPEVFYKFVDEGVCPTISKYLLGEKIDGKYSKASYSSNIITGLPSTSANSHVSIATGCYARKNNFLYTNFWDLTGKTAKIVESEKISPFAIRRFQKLINNKTKTLMEFFKDSVSFHALYKGAKIRYMRTRSLIWNFLPWAIRDDEFLADPNFWKTTFLKFILDYLKTAKRKKKMPGATLMAYLMTDQTSHLFGFDSPEYKNAVSTLDYLLSVLIEGYTKKNGKRIPGLKELGFLDDTIWVICSDHGSRKIYSDIYIMLGEKVRFDQDLNLSQGLLWKDKMFAKRFENRYHEFDGFIWTTNGLMFLWFSNPSGVDPSISKSNLEQFKQFYFEEQWRMYVPKKKNRRDDKPIDLITIFTQLKSIAFAVIPEPISETFIKPKGLEKKDKKEKKEKGQISALKPKERERMLIPRIYRLKIVSKYGRCIVERKEENGVIFYKYSIIEKLDPLRWAEFGVKADEWKSEKEWLDITYKLEYPDLFHRLFGLFDCIHAPNLLIIPKEKYNFFKFGDLQELRHQMKNFQSHDGPYRVESLVPLILSGPGIKQGYEIPYGRNIDILPTVLKAAGVPYDPELMDGKPLF